MYALVIPDFAYIPNIHVGHKAFCYKFSIQKKSYNPASKNLNKFSTILSGITELDNLVKGFRPSELILIGARPSAGKALFALSMVANIAVRVKNL
jgi:replicative DNA helicase